MASIPTPSMLPPRPKRRWGPQDDLPHPRRHSFKRKFEPDLETRFRDFLAAVPQAASSASPLGVALVIGRVVGRGTPQDVVLPVESEVLLEELPSHSFVPDLADAQVSLLRRFLDDRFAAHKEKQPNERRWGSVSFERRSVASCSWRAVATFYCPHNKWHYQLRLRQPQEKEGGQAKDRKELNLVFQKVTGGQDPAWTVSIVEEGAEKVWTELRMNEAFLLSHRERMEAAEQHNFSRLCRDFRRNAQALQRVMNKLDPLVTGDGGRRLFYPGIFDMASQVQEFYEKRTRVQMGAEGVDPTATVRRFNNCIKTMLLESFVDALDGGLRILDLCSGRGQDVGKYSQEHRPGKVKSLVCVDFAAEAVEEARHRYSNLVAKAQRAGRKEFAASFFTGDCRNGAVFNQLSQDGYLEFDVVVCQFGLHYLLATEEDAVQLLRRIFKLLRSGGRFIATVPSSEVLADLYEQATPSTDPARTWERELQRSLFHVRFQGEAWGTLQAEGKPMDVDEVFCKQWGLPYHFWLSGAVLAEEYLLPWKAFEDLAVATGFRVLADASFEDLFAACKPTSKYYNGAFSQERRNASMNRDEEEVFNLYSAFVLERP